jgi:predicted Rdx family selenoprotein
LTSSLAITTQALAYDALARCRYQGGGGGGITQLTVDVLAGPGSGAVAATVVQIHGASVPAAGALTVGNVLQVSGSSALTYGPVNLASTAAVTGLLPVANVAPGTNGQVLTTSGGATVWAVASSGGLNQLTGDVLAGPGTGSQVASVVGLHGASVPVPSTTIGNGLHISGTSTLSYAAVNLAGGAGWVTGELPVGNIAPGTNGQVLTTSGGVAVWSVAGSGGITQLTGDVAAGPGTGSVAATVEAINGASVPVSGALTTGNVLQVSGTSALSYGAVNLAGGANYVTGELPVGNVAPGTNGQFLQTSGGATVWGSAPSGGITQLTGDVTAGPGSGSQASTVVQIHGASVPAAGGLTTGNVLQVSGTSALTYAALNLAGGANYVTGELPVANVAPGTNGQFLQTSGGATVWGAAPSGGITQLTGDVTAGPGSGSQAATVAQIHGASVPAAGALTTGNVLQVTGTSALGYAAVNLAGGANFVTGELPVANIAPGTNGQFLQTTGGATVWGAAPSGGITQLTGDATAGPGSGSVVSTVVSAQSGVYTFGSGGTMQWASTATWLMDQASTTSATAANATWQPQQSTAATPTGGNAIVNLQGSSGHEASFVVQRSASDIFAVGTTQTSTTTVNLWMGVSSPSATNWTIQGSGTNTFLSCPANGGQIYFAIAGGNNATLSDTYFATGAGVSLGIGNIFGPSLGGSSGGISMANASALGTSAPTTAVVLAGDTTMVHGYQQGTFFTDQGMLPVFQGTHNSQVGKIYPYAGVCRTTSASVVTILTIPLATATTSASISVTLVGRDVTTIACGVIKQMFCFKNSAGTVTQSTTTAAAQLSADTALSSATIAVTISGTNILIQASSGTTDTVDWTATAEAMFN